EQSIEMDYAMFCGVDLSSESETEERPLIHTSIVRRGNLFGIGVDFGTLTAGKFATFEGSKCKAAAHAVMLALEELALHPETLLLRDWTIRTPCQFIADRITWGNDGPSECETCRCDGMTEDVARIANLMERLPHPVEVDLQWEPKESEKARQLAIESIRRVNEEAESAKGDEE
ncbi:hypothetical protein PENTCL1PPCAC_6024, partial [Pristionchus entomophagus]